MTLSLPSFTQQMTKMHTWNPYTSTMSEFPSAAVSFRHHFGGGMIGKSQEELRF